MSSGPSGPTFMLLQFHNRKLILSRWSLSIKLMTVQCFKIASNQHNTMSMYFDKLCQWPHHSRKCTINVSFHSRLTRSLPRSPIKVILYLIYAVVTTKSVDVKDPSKQKFGCDSHRRRPVLNLSMYFSQL